MADTFAEDKVLLRYHSGTAGRIAHISLNKPKALNAIDLEMVEAMLEILQTIRDDATVAAVLLDSDNDKAFCAGGDIVSMYRAMKEQSSENKAGSNDLSQSNESFPTPAFLKAFFTQEYRLDYCLHTFPKPVVVWGNGIIMGGGLGLFAGAHLKVVTPTARIAMPEITIGLFPDVGASFFLNQLPQGLGLFLGLTAASVNARDALSIGLGDVLLANGQKASFIEKMKTLDEISQDDLLEMANDMQDQEIEARAANLPNYLPEIAQLGEGKDVVECAQALTRLAQAYPEVSYLQKGLASFESGSAITAHLVFEQLKRSKSFSLAECFRMELSMAFSCGAFGEFEEGVRALLIDKDNTPQWKFENVKEVPSDFINAHFERLNTVKHPLANLEQDFGE